MKEHSDLLVSPTFGRHQLLCHGGLLLYLVLGSVFYSLLLLAVEFAGPGRPSWGRTEDKNLLAEISLDTWQSPLGSLVLVGLSQSASLENQPGNFYMISQAEGWSHCCLVCLLCFWGAEDWRQGLTHARQSFYYNHSPSTTRGLRSFLLDLRGYRWGFSCFLSI